MSARQKQWSQTSNHFASLSLSLAHLHDVLQVLLCVGLLRHQFGRLEVGLDEQVSVPRGVPVRTRDLHQAITQQQHQQEQAPGVGCCDPNGLELIPESDRTDTIPMLWTNTYLIFIFKWPSFPHVQHIIYRNCKDPLFYILASMYCICPLNKPSLNHVDVLCSIHCTTKYTHQVKCHSGCTAT